MHMGFRAILPLFVGIFLTCPAAFATGGELVGGMETSGRELIELIRDGIAAAQTPIRGKVLVVGVDKVTSGKIPMNYMSPDPTKRTELQNRITKEKVRLRFDGRFCWEHRQTQGRDEIRGYDGERRIYVSRPPNGQVNASITCELSYDDLATVPDPLYGQALRILFCGSGQESMGDENSYLATFLAEADSAQAGVRFNGIDVVSVSRSFTQTSVRGERRKVSETCYFKLAPQVHLVGWETRLAESLFRISVEYAQRGGQWMPIASERTSFYCDASGAITETTGHTRAEYRTLRFIDPVPASEYLPRIPSGARVRDNCALAPQPLVTHAPGEQRSGWIRWLFIAIGFGLIVVGIAFAWKKRNAK